MEATAPYPCWKMATPLIEYYQEILSKISYADRTVFRKELRKAFKRLVPADRMLLKQWFRSSCVCRVNEKGQTEGNAVPGGTFS